MRLYNGNRFTKHIFSVLYLTHWTKSSHSTVLLLHYFSIQSSPHEAFIISWDQFSIPCWQKSESSVINDRVTPVSILPSSLNLWLPIAYMYLSALGTDDSSSAKNFADVITKCSYFRYEIIFHAPVFLPNLVLIYNKQWGHTSLLYKQRKSLLTGLKNRQFFGGYGFSRATLFWSCSVPSVWYDVYLTVTGLTQYTEQHNESEYTEQNIYKNKNI
jgi:hypothetical protein